MALFNLFRKKEAVQPLQQRADVALNGREAAVNYTRDRSYLWAPTLEEAVNPPAATRREILRLARHLTNNFSLCERALTVCENYSVGQGLIANAATTDAAFNLAATDAFDAWANSVFCSANHSLTFYQMQRLMVREIITAGEVFLVLTKSDSGYPQLIVVASENIRHSGDKDDPSVDGIRYDDYGKAIEYTVFLGSKSIKVEAANVIHLLRPKNIGQLRGTSAFETGLNSVRDLKDLFQTEKKAVKTHSALAVAVTRKSGEAGDGLFNDLTPVAPNSANPARFTKGVERAMPGANVILEEGDKIELLTSNRSTDGFHKFLESLMRDVCLGLGLPYEVLINADKLSGSGIRFVIADAASFIASLQTLIQDAALRRIYVWVTASFLKEGKLPKPQTSNPWAVSFVNPPSITVDTSRVSNAEISLLQNSLLTFDQYYSARGKNWREELKQRAEEEAYLSALAAQYALDVNRLRSLAAGGASIVETDEEPTAQPAPATPEVDEEQAAA